MKFSTTKDELAQNLAIVSRIVPKNPSHPVLGNILIRVTDESVYLTAYDFSVGFTNGFPAEVSKTGSLAVSGKMFADIVSKIPDGKVDIELVGDRILLRHSKGKFHLPVVDASEFPSFPEIEGDGHVQIPAIDLLTGLKGCLPFASSDELKQLLTGIHLNASNGTLRFRSTDGYRLAAIDISTKGEMLLTVPAKPLSHLLKALESDQSELVDIRFDNAQASFGWGQKHYTSRVLAGGYPKVDQIIPTTFEREVKCDRALLVSIIERVAIVAETQSGVLKDIPTMKISECKIRLFAKSDSGESEEDISANLTGSEITIKFNQKYMLEILKVLEGKDVFISLNSPSKPVIVKGSSDQARYVLVPVG